MTELPYRQNVCMLVYNRKRLIFLGERLGEPGVWQLPQGGVNDFLSPEENVIKELHEELGAEKKLFKVRKRLNSTHKYDYREIPEYARGRWRGQSQSFWLVEFFGRDSDIDIGKYTPEFSAWRWCTVDDIKAMAEPVRLPGYLEPLEEFKQFMAVESSSNA